MKKILKKIILTILIFEARLVLMRFKPNIIAVTGSVGKTTTKDALYTALKGHYKTRKNQKSFNSEFGVPLTILGLDTGWNSLTQWLLNIVLGAGVLFKREYPEWLVLETGVDKPGDMEVTAKWLKPLIAVFTAFPSTPVHVEQFASAEAVWNEKKKLATYVRPGGAIILNADDEHVMKIKDIAKREIYTFGTTDDADVYVSHNEIVYDSDTKSPIGVSFKVNVGDTSIPVTLQGVLGKQHMYPVAAALALGKSQKISLVEMAAAFTAHEYPKSRMCILEGKEGTTIIDDSYNASPIATEAALNTLADIKTEGKRIVVLGDMLELGAHTAREHKMIGALVAKLKIDYLIGVGIRAEFITDEAQAQGMKAKQIFHVKDASEVVSVVEKVRKPGDVILCKGSQGIRVEKAVVALMAHPESAGELVARQDAEWKKR